MPAPLPADYTIRRRLRWPSAVALAFLLLLPPGLLRVAAQAPPKHFDVTSVKPIPDWDPMMEYPGAAFGHGLVSLPTVTVSSVLQTDLMVGPDQVIGPDWIKFQHFAIRGKVSGDHPNRDLMLMLQSLLADRFHLVWRHDTRPMDAYRITVAAGGAKLKPADLTKPEGTQANTSLANLSPFLARLLHRPVLDSTGLGGAYNFTGILNLSSGPHAPFTTGEDADAYSFDMLARNLKTWGLVLKPRHLVVPVVVVTRVSEPSPD